MSLKTYEDAKPWARAIKEAALTRHMPNWRAARGYGDFSNDPSLSPFEIALIAAWVDGGAPKDPAVTNSEARLGPERGGGAKPAEGRPPSESERGWGPASAEKSRQSQPKPANLRTLTLPCGTTPLPQGTLLAVQPTLKKDQSIGVAVKLPDGRREIVAWIRGYDPRYPTTYWLRTPLTLPAGSVLISDPQEGCAITLTLRRQ
jgi:hypothetical protein